MLKEFLLRSGIKSQAAVEDGGYVEMGYGQVEPNHLSAQRNGKIYAQRPVEGLELVENGMFLKYETACSALNFKIY